MRSRLRQAVKNKYTCNINHRRFDHPCTYLGVGVGNSKWTMSVGLVVLSGSGLGFFVEDTSYTIGISIDLEHNILDLLILGGKSSLSLQKIES